MAYYFYFKKGRKKSKSKNMVQKIKIGLRNIALFFI